MSVEISKNYDPVSVEAEANRIWMEERCFAADPRAPGEAYSIVIPPPNVTGALHLGHAINNTLQDVLVRNHRMRGFNTVWIPGIDHAGIATQAVVEKQLKEKENKTRHDVGREELVRRIWEWKEQYGIRIVEQIKRMGCSCDWERTRFTLDDQCARAVRETFFKLFKDGLIYRGKRLVNWDVHLQTSISDDEIYHETVKTSMWHIRYPIEGTGKFLVVATTRPETMLGDTAVAVHSEDSRWNWAIGKSVDLPLTGRKIPIIADDILVDPKFGSGVVKVTPAHDPNDYAVWQRHQGKADQIDIVNILNPDGTINQNGGKYSGMKRDAARKQVVEDLTAIGLLAKEDPYETQVGHSDRSKTPVEPYLSDQWFVKMAPLAEPALEVVRDGTVKFFPERHAQQYLSWLGEKRDWPISRQLWWGHRIPVWRVSFDKGNRWIHEFQKSGLSRPTSHGFVTAAVERLFHGLESDEIPTLLVADPAIKRHTSRQERADGFNEDDSSSVFFCTAITEADEIFRQLAEELDHKKSNKPVHSRFAEVVEYITEVEQDPDVLDTWFSSALWPHSTLGWPEDTPELRKWYPTSVLATGRDIITLWVARMVMAGIYNMKEVPFHHVYIHPTILDGKGEQMKKSRGNGVDPVDVIETHGADALRFTMTLMATETQDVRMPVKKDAQGRNTSDKFDIGRNFCNKIWNVANNFVIHHLADIKPEAVDEGRWSLADRWIVSRFNRTVGEANAALAGYRFDQYAKMCYDFFWNDFCALYVEVCKPALKVTDAAGQTADVLAAVLDGALRLMHPIIPFITEIIWGRLNDVRPNRGLPGRLECPGSKRLIRAAWPVAGDYVDPAEAVFSRMNEIVTAIRKMRNDYKVDLKRRVESNRGMIELLGVCRLQIVGSPIPGVAHASAGGCDIFALDLQDRDALRERDAKQKADLARRIQTMEARLANESYAAKAPQELVRQTRDQLAEAKRELAKIQNTDL
jgi:valyl-tRNA synthetase